MAASVLFLSTTLLLLLANSFHILEGRLIKPPAKPRFKSHGPYNVAHRGANGEFPESSIAAFKRAIENGADFIETDIGSTRDGVLICMHDTTLDAVTDVAQHPEFAHKKAMYVDEGVNVTGFFAVDFTLQEIKTLRLRQRYDFRDQSYNGLFEIPTFEEYIAVALEADRVVGIDPEIKSPFFINKHVKWPGGELFEDRFVKTLLKYGYNDPYNSQKWLKQPVFIQTFAPTSILHIANKTKSPKIFALGPADALAQDTKLPYSHYYTDEFLDFIANYVTALSTKKFLIVPMDSSHKNLPATDFVERAHVRDLLVQTATFSNEAQFMARDFAADPEQEFDYFIRKVHADIILADHPATLSHYLK
ncbi:hypothetical protein SELMODRAFT_130410 [Selaginella moellendorffii]|uniref:glycerophosphodiester phosphodiesterase n=1 Tax=Selaginella moellendorffii TaxID=88036 RepID=D8T2B6_SELML|nr:glycerophosphodiester phosphodiesterase GDPD6 [Selaginella moellendorffii]EFJ09234.1 hypothetical protein SELMODRAFT_130410 [Selaginella moellendorffii]|eukprot:XP_002989757.1 glycerophosphodiester phosphodiesterase GDPD6 [Selaginella moellendorffii]